MSAKFTEEDREKLRVRMIQIGFKMLKNGGIRAVNIDEITKQSNVAKGSFYTLFEIFSYLDGQHTRWLVSKWPPEYLENEENDEQTARRIISLLARPKENPDWQLFCNYLKLLALTLNSRELLVEDAADRLIDHLIDDACGCICI